MPILWVMNEYRRSALLT